MERIFLEPFRVSCSLNGVSVPIVTSRVFFVITSQKQRNYFNVKCGVTPGYSVPERRCKWKHALSNINVKIHRFEICVGKPFFSLSIPDIPAIIAIIYLQLIHLGVSKTHNNGVSIYSQQCPKNYSNFCTCRLLATRPFPKFSQM